MKPGSSEDAEPFIVHVCHLGKLCGVLASDRAGSLMAAPRTLTTKARSVHQATPLPS